MSFKDAFDAGSDTHFRVPVELLPTLIKRIEQINKKAKQLSTDPVSLTRSGEVERMVTKMGGRIGRMIGPSLSYDVEYVEVKGNTPIIEGWKFVAAVRHSRAGNNFEVTPGLILTDEQEFRMGDYKTAERRCDHCHTNRVRNSTYLLLHTVTDEFKLVGSTCLKDFTGANDPMVAAKAYENIFKLFAEVYEMLREVPRTTKTFALQEWLAFVAQSIRIEGWKSRRDYADFATASVAKKNLLKWPDSKTPADIDFDRAQTWIDWARAQESDGSEFMDKLLAIMSMDDGIDEHDMGISAAVGVSMERAQREEAKKLAQTTQNYYGEVDGKYTLTLEVSKIGGYAGGYGWTTIYNMTDGQDHFVWFSSKDAGLEEGKTYTLTGTVKAHDVNRYTGNKQTVLTRCTKIEEV